jgi:hypothetical protein
LENKLITQLINSFKQKRTKLKKAIIKGKQIVTKIENSILKGIYRTKISILEVSNNQKSLNSTDILKFGFFFWGQFCQKSGEYF